MERDTEAFVKKKKSPKNWMYNNAFTTYLQICLPSEQVNSPSKCALTEMPCLIFISQGHKES